jgi:hypothetical protein
LCTSWSGPEGTVSKTQTFEEEKQERKRKKKKQKQMKKKNWPPSSIAALTSQFHT